MSFQLRLCVLIIYLTVGECIQEFTLSCVGDKLTNTNCQKLCDLPGCYWLKDFNQYRSCGSLCNDVKVLHELKCKAYCEGKAYVLLFA